jgi:hypothetical protein
MFVIKMKDEMATRKWEWLFVDILHMRIICYNGYYNAFGWV